MTGLHPRELETVTLAEATEYARQAKSAADRRRR